CGSNNEIADRTLANKLRVQGDVTLGLGIYTSYLSGDVDLTGTSRTLTLSNSAIFNGSVSNGTLRLVSTSPTRFLALGGSNQFSGVLNLGGGLLVLSNQHALRGVTQILFNGNSTNGGTLGLTASNNADYSAIFSSADLQNYRVDTGGVDSTLATSLGSTNGTFSKSGLGTLTLPVANLFSGGATLAGGRLALGHNQALGTGEFLVDQSGVEIEALVPHPCRRRKPGFLSQQHGRPHPEPGGTLHQPVQQRLSNGDLWHFPGGGERSDRGRNQRYLS
ncbi:MAG: hypothetical protein EBT77_07640, partial [Verrucomicrobia bacterium]|nr:hypothetical protein [Verrucomicrobiota bacterium]